MSDTTADAIPTELVADVRLEQFKIAFNRTKKQFGMDALDTLQRLIITPDGETVISLKEMILLHNRAVESGSIDSQLINPFEK